MSSPHDKDNKMNFIIQEDESSVLDDELEAIFSKRMETQAIQRTHLLLELSRANHHLETLQESPRWKLKKNVLPEQFYQEDEAENGLWKIFAEEKIIEEQSKIVEILEGLKANIKELEEGNRRLEKNFTTMEMDVKALSKAWNKAKNVAEKQLLQEQEEKKIGDDLYHLLVQRQQIDWLMQKLLEEEIKARDELHLNVFSSGAHND